tara:strand:- start:558 stop:2111 length:1554 start_codon:yes stop_codon:yes gene_type:complete
MNRLSISQLEAKVADLERENEFLKNNLRENERKRNDFLTLSLNTLADPVFVKDADSRLVLVNDAFCKIFQISRENVIGKTLAEHVPPEERESFLAIDRQVLDDGIENINEESLTVEGKASRIISTKKSRFIDTQGNKFLVGVIRDFTARIKAEEEFRSLFTQSVIPSALLDLNDLIIKCNQAFCDFIGYSSNEILGKKLKSFVYPEVSENQFQALDKSSKNSSESSFAKPFLRKDGAKLWGEVSTSSICNKHEEPQASLAVIQDITEKYQALKELEKNQLKLKDLNDTKDKMFSIIAHDLRGPVGNTLSLSELLQDKDSPLEDSERKEYFKLITQSIKGTKLLLDNLLNWANSQRGKVQPKYKTLIINTVIENVFISTKAAASRKSISLSSTVDNKVIAQSDPDMLETIIRNLINNAIKFTGKGGEIVVSALSNTNQIEITVSDTGIGMTEEQRLGLFKLETHASTRGTENEKGSGLGLLLCKDFVELLAGTISIRSTLGKGSSFKIELPISPPAID